MLIILVKREQRLESKTNYTIVGLVVLLLAAGLLSASLWLSVSFDRKRYDQYIVYVPEAVSGLSEDSPVKFNGVRVGVVRKIELNQSDPQQVKILLNIEAGTPITTSTHATLINQGITGTNYLGLSAGSPSLFPLPKTPGEPYPVIPYKASFFSQLEKNINDISVGITRVFDKENAKNLKKSLANLQKLTDVLANNSKNFDKSFKDLPKLMESFKSGADKFTTMAGDLSHAGKQISVTMKTGKDGIDKISQQTLPPMILLLQRLDLIGANLEKVSDEMRQNPSVIIRGNAPPQPGPGE